MNRPGSTILCGLVSAALGGFYLLEALGAPPGLPRDADRGLVACCGAMFFFGGLAVLLTLARGRLARTTVAACSLIIVVCMAATAGWVAVDAPQGSISGPLAFISPKLNDVVGRVGFGLGALLLTGFAAMIFATIVHRGPAADGPPEADGDAEPPP